MKQNETGSQSAATTPKQALPRVPFFDPNDTYAYHLEMIGHINWIILLHMKDHGDDESCFAAAEYMKMLSLGAKEFYTQPPATNGN